MNSRECDIFKIKKEILDIDTRMLKNTVNINSDELFLTIKAYNVQSYRVQNLSLNVYQKVIEEFMNMCNFVWMNNDTSKIQKLEETKTNIIFEQENLSLGEEDQFPFVFSFVKTMDDNMKNTLVRKCIDGQANEIEREGLVLYEFVNKYKIDLNSEDVQYNLQNIYLSSKNPKNKNNFEKAYNYFKFCEGEWMNNTGGCSEKQTLDVTNPKTVEIGRYTTFFEIQNLLNIKIGEERIQTISNDRIEKLESIKLKKSLETLFEFRDLRREGSKRVRVTEQNISKSDNKRYLKHLFDYFGIEFSRGDQKRKWINGQKTDISDYYISPNNYIEILQKIKK
jgi:hypothetical protein